MSDFMETAIHLCLLLIFPRVNGELAPKSSRIVDGADAGEDEFRYIVAMIMKDPKGVDFIAGGGSILNEKWIVTARHVVLNEERTKIENIEVTPKYNNEVEKILSTKLKRYRISKVFCTPADDDEDISLVKLSESIPLDKYFEKIPIHDKMNWSSGILIAGWGFMKKDKFAYAKTLQKGHLRHKSKPCPDCKVLEIDHYREGGACKGDSGGPAVIRNKGTSSDELIGIVSRGQVSCRRYTNLINLSYYKNWIDDVIKNEPTRYLCLRK